MVLAVVAPQGQHRVGRAERRLEQAVRVQPLDPLGVEHVGLGSSTAVGQLARLDQVDLEATRLEQLKERNPIDPRGFHGYRGDVALGQPVRQGSEVGSIGGKAAYRLGIVTGGHCHIMGFGPDVDTRGVEVGGGQLWWECGLGAALFRLAWGHGHLHNSRRISQQARERRD